MNKTVAYQKSGRLDWETNKFKLEAVVTKNGAIAPQPVQLTTDARFSAPMLSMGRRRATGVKMLREISRGAPKANRARIENIIKLYEKRNREHQNGGKHRGEASEQNRTKTLHRQSRQHLQQINWMLKGARLLT